MMDWILGNFDTPPGALSSECPSKGSCPDRIFLSSYALTHSLPRKVTIHRQPLAITSAKANAITRRKVKSMVKH
jgi:hypothetical protein